MGSEDKVPVISHWPLMFPTAQQLRTHPLPHMAVSLIWGYNDAHDTKCMPTLDGMDKTKAETTGLGFSTRLTWLRSSTKQPVFSSVFATDEGPSYGQTCNLWRSPSSPCCLRVGAGLAPLSSPQWWNDILWTISPRQIFLPSNCLMLLYSCIYRIVLRGLSFQHGIWGLNWAKCACAASSFTHWDISLAPMLLLRRNLVSTITKTTFSALYLWYIPHEWPRREQPFTHGSVFK